MEVRPGRLEDGVEAFLREHNADRVARLGVLEDALAHPHLVALDPGLAGVLTYVLRADDCEVLTLHAARSRHGAGTALLEAVRAIAGDRRLWLMTTNDNVDALRFYQRRGFRLAKLHANAVDYSRTHLKPEIPLIGNYGIPLRDELELEG
ncbi:MAG TPA: GNAT family N-acetyltransferase [Solirubrobacter sp.]